MSKVVTSSSSSGPSLQNGEGLNAGKIGATSFGLVEPSSVDEVYTQILLRIVQGVFPSGTVLTSTRLALQLKVSRTPINAALDRLVADGLLKKERNKRAVVREGAEHWLAQVHQLREMLEPPAAGLAAVNITSDALEELYGFRRAAEPRKSDEWMMASRRFDQAIHLAVADFCGNLPLRRTIYKCWSYKQLIFDAGYDNPSLVETGYHEHAAILQALARHDAATASAAMLFHLRSASCIRADLGIV
jgi:DNA-binding GntR family transcriptional regulator